MSSMQTKARSACETCRHNSNDFLYPGCQNYVFRAGREVQVCRYVPQDASVIVPCADGYTCPKRERCVHWLGGGIGEAFFRVYGPECPKEVC